ncbi:hypothetical protein [Legionella tunisiensis]|uniref:hypothetical protein n=1 Tax=Legionella tunisiensis TaxID=1034944 RepID=UPI00036E9550|nr:hypothetical protein [Legionella tunisiensis]
MRIFHINDTHWIHEEHHLQIAGNMVRSYTFEELRDFIIKNQITSLDINRQIESESSDKSPWEWEMQTPLPWPEYLYISVATTLLQFLEGTPVSILNLAENCQGSRLETPLIKKKN